MLNGDKGSEIGWWNSALESNSNCVWLSGGRVFVALWTHLRHDPTHFVAHPSMHNRSVNNKQFLWGAPEPLYGRCWLDTDRRADRLRIEDRPSRRNRKQSYV